MLLSVLLALGGEGEPPNFLYKILSVLSWEQSQNSDRLLLGPDDTEFIHLAEEHQVERIARKFFADEDRVVIVKLRTSLLQGRLVKESNPGGSKKYYHLYEGFIPLEAVDSHTILEI